MCIYTSLVERTPGAGRHENFSAGVASASAINCCDTCLHSPSYPCQIPSGYCAGTAGTAKKRKNKNERNFTSRLLSISFAHQQLRDLCSRATKCSLRPTKAVNGAG